MTENTDTIRLSDRLELRPVGHPLNPGSYPQAVINGKASGYMLQPILDALIEACTPSRLILPPGVEQGYVLKAGNPLPDEWEVFYENGWLDPGPHARSADAWSNHDVLCRPTAANPLPTLPATCWQIPDGRINCLRKDAQALRDMGWTIWQTSRSGGKVSATYDADRPEQVVEARPPAKPATERVPWWEAKGRTSPNGYEITDVEWRKHQDHPFFYAKQGWKHADADGTVEVLVEGDAS